MLAILLGLFRLIWLFGRGHDAVALENLTLRQQLAIYKRKNKRPNPARPLVLDCTGHHLEGLATSAVGGSPRHGCALAAPAFPGLLGGTLESVWEVRSTANWQGDS